MSAVAAATQQSESKDLAAHNMEPVTVGKLAVAETLYRFVADEALKGAELSPDRFWNGFAAIVEELGPRNRALLAERDRLQSQIDQFHRRNRDKAWDQGSYLEFLSEIGYVLPEPADQAISTANVDDEIARIAGPQLVVPLSNARYALNAANARWGSLYDALYGTDVIAEDAGAARGTAFNPVRGAQVVARAKAFLDEAVPLQGGSYTDLVGVSIEGGTLRFRLSDGSTVGLAYPTAFAGYRGTLGSPDVVLLKHNGLGVQLVFDRSGLVGRTDPAGLSDVVLEAAVSTIMDMEDSVAAVDAEDKVAIYRNWLGLVSGDLTAKFPKGGRTVERRLHPDLEFAGPDGQPLSVPGRSMMLVRNVGHHMYTDAVLFEGEPVPEGFLDAAVSVLIAKRDLAPGKTLRNSRTGSIYIVKPKMHGPAEVSLTDDLFARVEDLVGVPALSVKMGIMDEERRTSANLKSAILAAADRVVFINTGFLDRTGRRDPHVHRSRPDGPQERHEEHGLDQGL